jgi:hypothetical protein
MEVVNQNTSVPKRPVYLWITAMAAAILLLVYAWVYYLEPFTPISEYLNDKIGDVIVLTAALATAIFGSILTSKFKSSEPPFRIWLTFTIGWWFWVAGEVIGFVYDKVYWTTDYPEFTWIDFCWVAGYFLFGLSLYYQFRLIYTSKKECRSIYYLAFIALAGLIALGLTRWAFAAGLGADHHWLAVYLAVLYPVFDVFEGGAALWLFFLFGRGYLGRPWWGLVAFAFADSINIYTWVGGFDKTADAVYNVFDLFSALAYLGGYLITALAFLAAIDHMHRLSKGPAELAPDFIKD